MVDGILNPSSGLGRPGTAGPDLDAVVSVGVSVAALADCEYPGSPPTSNAAATTEPITAAALGRTLADMVGWTTGTEQEPGSGKLKDASLSGCLDEGQEFEGMVQVQGVSIPIDISLATIEWNFSSLHTAR